VPKDHSSATSGEQKPSEHLSFGVGYGFIVTATNDGSIPLNAKALAKIEPGGDEAIREMQRRANAYPRLVEALRAIAKPALGGKIQQYTAQAILCELGEL
jgi:hypothetical protein